MKFIIIILLFSFHPNFSKAQNKREKSGYEIKLTSSKLEYSLGESVLVRIDYINNTNKKWNLIRPDSSFFNSISYRNVMWRTENRWSGYSFNKSKFVKIDSNCINCGYTVPITKGYVTIKPNDIFSFETDIMKNSKNHFFDLPGKYIIRFSDGSENLKSDTIEICMVFTRNSINHLIKRLLEEKEQKENIEWITNLLQIIYPDISKYKYDIKNNVIAYSKSQIDYNRIIIDKLDEFIKSNWESVFLKERIKEINTDLNKYKFLDLRKKNKAGNCIQFE